MVRIRQLFPTIIRTNEPQSDERRAESTLTMALNVMFVARKRFTIADDYARAYLKGDARDYPAVSATIMYS